MVMMKNSSRTLVIYGASILVGLLILLFIFLRVSPLLQGSQVVAINLEPIQEYDEYIITLEAEVEHAESALINGIPVSINQDDRIVTSLALAPGRNVINLVLTDTIDNTQNFEYIIITPALDEVYTPEYNEAVSVYEQESSDELSTNNATTETEPGTEQ
jgi:hypothetical protein